MLNEAEIKNLIENKGFRIEDNEFKEVILYLSNKNGDLGILSKLLIRKISFEKEKNEDKLKNLEINSIISFFSLAKLDAFDLTPVEKSKKIFKKISKIFLIVTKESKNQALKYLEVFKNNKVEFKIYEIETGDYEEVYNLLRFIIGENCLEKENIVIDNTLGNKMTSAVFYRFGVEQGIKLITWQNEQVNDLNGIAKRVPGTEKFNFIKEPEFFNFNTFKNIDTLLKKYKFEEAQMLFEQLNNRDMYSICKAFSKIFNFETLSNLDGIYDEIPNFLELTSSIEDPVLNKKIKKYRYIFSLLLKDENSSVNFFDNLDEINWSSLTDYYLNKIQNYSLSKEEKTHFVALIVIEYFINAYPYDLAYICIDNTLTDDFIMISSENFKTILLSLYSNEKTINDVASLLKIEDIIADLFIDCEKLIFKPNLDFCKNLSNKIVLVNGLLTVPSLGINELLLKKLESDTKSRNSVIIYELFEQQNYLLSSNKIIEIFKDTGKEITDKQRISKYYGDLKKSIKELNYIIKEEAKKRGKDLEEFFILEKEFNKSFKSLKINKKF